MALHYCATAISAHRLLCVHQCLLSYRYVRALCALYSAAYCDANTDAMS